MRLSELCFSLATTLVWYSVECMPSDETVAAHSNRRNLDICSHWNGRRQFLEMGDRGDLHAQNVSISSSYKVHNPLFTPMSLHNENNSLDIWYQCNIELVTCSECVIRVSFTHTNFSMQCDEPEDNNHQNYMKFKKCPCEYILFSEPPYEQDISGQEYCGEGKTYRSKTRTLNLKLVYRAASSHVFSLQYFSERNVKILSGSPRHIVKNAFTRQEQHIISTPYFPLPYPRDYGIEHIITCEAENCRVKLDFTDFQLGFTSTLDIFDSDGQMIDSYTGERFRPPIIISNGKSILIQFRGNGVTGPGFRAEVAFITEKHLGDNEVVPFTDCGGMVTGTGGAITMMNMIDNSSDIRPYDCIWIIKPSNNYHLMKTHISLRVDVFFGLLPTSKLVIRQGTTSLSPKIDTVIVPTNGAGNVKNHIVPINSGFYVRLQGLFEKTSKIAIVYSIFNYMNCYIGSEFLCTNNHCISIRLRCDGFDHCGDGSDEPALECEQEWEHIQADRRWYTHKPNYYFPKMEQYPDLRTATGIFIVSTVGIIAVLSGWMVVLYRMGVRSRNQREFHNHLQTINRQDEPVAPVDNTPPPDYEAPPDYDDVIKVGMDNEIIRGRPGRSCDAEQPSTSRREDLPNTIEVAIRRPEDAKATASTTDAWQQTDSELRRLTSSTITPYEERSIGFQDESLNISLSLALSSPTATETAGKDYTLCGRPKSSEVCSEMTHLKKSWITFYDEDGGKYSYKVQKLRHTFSSPETFLMECTGVDEDFTETNASNVSMTVPISSSESEDSLKMKRSKSFCLDDRTGRSGLNRKYGSSSDLLQSNNFKLYII